MGTLENKTIAVTGASGMLGPYICRELLRCGAKVVGVVRDPQKAAFLAKEGVEFRRADLADRAALTAAFRGADAVVSNAAMYVMSKILFSWDAHVAANVEGTRNVYEAMRAAGVNRAIQISTCGVYRIVPFRRYNADSPQVNGAKKQGGAYRASKQLSEQLAWDLSREYGIALTSLRPYGIYGARDTNTMPLLRMLMKIPLLPFPNLVIPLCYAGDVAIAVSGALANSAAVGKAYVTGGSDASLIDFARAAKQVWGWGPKVLPITPRLGIYCDNSAAERDLGYKNRPFVEGLREMQAEEQTI